MRQRILVEAISRRLVYGSGDIESAGHARHMRSFGRSAYAKAGMSKRDFAMQVLEERGAPPLLASRHAHQKVTVRVQGATFTPTILPKVSVGEKPVRARIPDRCEATRLRSAWF